MVSLSSFFYLLLLQQMLQVVIACDALQFILHNLLHLFLDAPVVRLHRFLHVVVAVLVREIGNDRNFLVGTFLPFDLFGIHHNLAVENLLLDALVEVVGHRTDKHTLRKTGNLARRDERVHLRVDGGGHVLPVDGDGLPLLEYLAETFRKALGRFPDYLPGENIADCILDHLRLFFTVVTGQLGKVLEAETDCHLVASCGGYQVIDTAKIDGRKLVNDDGTLELPLLVH